MSRYRIVKITEPDKIKYIVEYKFKLFWLIPIWLEFIRDFMSEEDARESIKMITTPTKKTIINYF